MVDSTPWYDVKFFVYSMTNINEIFFHKTLFYNDILCFFFHCKGTDFLQGGEYHLYSKCIPNIWGRADID